jgi:hypothetical protein
MAPSERVQVKAECLRLLAMLELNREKMELISGFIGTYLRLDEAEEEEFQQAVERMNLGIFINEPNQEEILQWLAH